MQPSTSALRYERPTDPARAAEEKAGFAEEALPHLRAVYRFALRLSRGDESEAEDIVQDTYLRAYRAWDTYSRGTRCCSWLFTICRNVAVRRGEGRTRREYLASNLGVDDVTALMTSRRMGEPLNDPEGEFFTNMVDDEVRRAIDRLPVEYREAIVLCDLEGLGYRDIASRLGVASGTIKSRIHRGRRILHDVLYEYAVEVGHIERPAGHPAEG